MSYQANEFTLTFVSRCHLRACCCGRLLYRLIHSGRGEGGCWPLTKRHQCGRSLLDVIVEGLDYIHVFVWGRGRGESRR